MSTIGYTFDGDYFSDSEAGRQELLENISEAIRTEAGSDATLTTYEEVEEAHSMAFDGTHYQAEFWENIMAIMQQSPYQIDVKRIDSETATEEEREALEYCA